MIIGTGIDLIEIRRVKVAMERPQFIRRVYTPAEQAYCESRGRQSAASFAARFAGKEAVMKALGTGLAGGTWQDIEILPDERGRPEVLLRGSFAKLAEKLGVTGIFISLTHAQDYAAADVVLWGGDKN
jgi:holo-[acyl-carrier protein] synthase